MSRETRNLILVVAFLSFMFGILVPVSKCQTTTQPTSAFTETTVNFNLTPVNLPGLNSLTGAETDGKVQFTNNFDGGPTSLLSNTFVFAGGRGDYLIQPLSKLLNNLSPSLNGYQFQFGATGSIGVVKPVGSSGSSRWGERVGMFINYKLSATTGLALEIQANNFPGYSRWTPSFAFGPNFHF